MGGAVKKVTKAITKPISKVVGMNGPEIQQQVAAPTPVAVEVAPPTQMTQDTESDQATESARKKARSGGKKSLSVSRSSGTGISI